MNERIDCKTVDNAVRYAIEQKFSIAQLAFCESFDGKLTDVMKAFANRESANSIYSYGMDFNTKMQRNGVPVLVSGKLYSRQPNGKWDENSGKRLSAVFCVNQKNVQLLSTFSGQQLPNVDSLFCEER
jgi:hypothetical protein